MTAIARIEDLRAYYITNAYGVKRTVQAVDNVSLEIRANEVYGIAGESGCGKSTLLKVLLGNVEPPLTVVGGGVSYRFGDQTVDLLKLSKDEIKQTRWKEVSYIPQGSMHVLNPVRRIYTTFRDVIGTHTNKGRSEADAMTREYLKELGLPEIVFSSYPHQLSGGMRQRVTIALATILWPKLIVADEPTTALDVVVQRGVIQLLKEIQEREENTLVVVTHDMGVHANLADRVGVLYAGKLVEEADTRTIFKQPQHPYTQYLIQSLPKMDDRTDRVSIPGRPPALDRPPSGCRFHTRCPLAMARCQQEEPPMLQVAANHRVACFLVAGENGHGSQP